MYHTGKATVLTTSQNGWRAVLGRHPTVTPSCVHNHLKLPAWFPNVYYTIVLCLENSSLFYRTKKLNSWWPSFKQPIIVFQSDFWMPWGWLSWQAGMHIVQPSVSCHPPTIVFILFLKGLRSLHKWMGEDLSRRFIYWLLYKVQWALLRSLSCWAPRRYNMGAPNKSYLNTR